MNTTHDELVTRESILKLLSADELSRVCTAESQPSLITGEDYLDLKHLDRGVRRARPYLGVKGTAPMGQVLPKSAVRSSTWARILAQLPPH